MNKRNNKIANIKELISLFYPEKYRAPYWTSVKVAALRDPLY
jgi:hypothetical protein